MFSHTSEAKEIVITSLVQYRLFVNRCHVCFYKNLVLFKNVKRIKFTYENCSKRLCCVPSKFPFAYYLPTVTEFRPSAATDTVSSVEPSSDGRLDCRKSNRGGRKLPYSRPARKRCMPVTIVCVCRL